MSLSYKEVSKKKRPNYSNNINLLVIVLIFVFLMSSIKEPVFSFDMVYKNLPTLIKPRK
jgi:hypothetical protein